MADTRYQPQTRTGTQVRIDEGLRSYMLGVYNYMALGVAFTAIIVMAVAANPAALAAVYSLKWVFFIATLGLGFFAPRLIFSGNTALAHAAYWGYCALWGLMIAPMVGHYLGLDSSMVYRAFLISAATFGATSLAGYVTKRDLSGFGAFFHDGRHRHHHCHRWSMRSSCRAPCSALSPRSSPFSCSQALRLTRPR